MLKIPHDTRVFGATERRRRAILDASVDLICQGGPSAITYRAVAALAKVPPSLVTYHFTTREELVREAFRHYLIEAQAWLTATTREQGASAADLNAAKVVRFVVETVRLSFTDPKITRAEYELILYAANDPVLAREFRAYQRGAEAALATILERLGARRPLDAARTIVDLVRGFELERFTYPAAQLEDLRRRLTTVVEALLAPAPQQTPRRSESGSRSKSRIRRGHRLSLNP
ncbi:MAG TPA: TetR family transcriptional regulator [Candidatus Binatia bacterium]|nr:TetR family transcriptional regulator [Candidatus Binatia bacterium]